MDKDSHLVNNVKHIVGYLTYNNDKEQVGFFLEDVYKALRIRASFSKYYRESLSKLNEDDYKQVWKRKDTIYDIDSLVVKNIPDKCLIRTGHIKGALLTPKGLYKVLSQSVLKAYLRPFNAVYYNASDAINQTLKRKYLKKYYNLFL